MTIYDTPGYTYLKSRNVDREEIDLFDLCYCDDRGYLYHKQGHALEKPGNTTNSKDPSKFDNSVVIPVFDLYNEYLGMYIRRLNPQRKKIDGTSWDKVSHLYGLNKAWKHCVEQGFIFLAEGPFDKIACSKYGYHNSAAIMGTALSAVQMSLIARFCKKVVLILDNDKAGKKASSKIYEELSVFGLQGMILNLPDDPDVELKKDPLILGKLLTEGENQWKGIGV